MAYSPFDEGRLVHKSKLQRFAREHGMTAAQVALAWLLAHERVIAIPKTGRRMALEENVKALAIKFTPEQLHDLDSMFPPPERSAPLAMA
jgi:aldehyde reductase